MNTLFDKIWDKHVVQIVPDGPTQLYIDRLYCHEVTSPQAFAGMRARGLKMFRPDQIFCMPDHNTPTHDQDKPIEDPISKKQVDTLAKNTADFGVTHFAMNTKDNGIIHVVGPEKGLSLPGMTIVCGDSHTSTHGAMGAVAFGIGTSEVEMVMASQCILQSKPKSMRISINGKLSKGVTAKDVALYLMSQLTTSGATGYFVEYSGDVVKDMSMEGRLTLCNLSIEMGARGGFVAPDETTFEYIKGREYAPKGERRQRTVHPQTRDRTLEHGRKVIERERARHIAGNRRARRYQARKSPARNMVDRHRIVLENLAQQLAALAVYIARVEYVELLCHGKYLAKAVVTPHNLSLISTLVLNRVVIEPR